MLEACGERREACGECREACGERREPRELKARLRATCRSREAVLGAVRQALTTQSVKKSPA